MHQSIKLVLALSAVLTATSVAKAEDLSAVMTCWNPQQNPVSLNVAANPAWTGKKATAAVQFNVLRPPSKETIFVNDANHGVCKIVLGEGLKLITAPQWSASGEDPVNAFSKLKVTSSTGADENGRQVVTYDVSSNGTSVPSTVTLTFSVFYQ